MAPVQSTVAVASDYENICTLTHPVSILLLFLMCMCCLLTSLSSLILTETVFITGAHPLNS